jgi:hypothetical protein
MGPVVATDGFSEVVREPVIPARREKVAIAAAKHSRRSMMFSYVALSAISMRVFARYL